MHFVMRHHVHDDLNTQLSYNLLFVEDFSGVATTTTFSLGSMIPIAASVAQQNHQPLILLLDECLASTTPELAPESRVYPLITNKGYVCRQDVPFLKSKMF